MTSNRARANSPPPRVYLDAPRASMGTGLTTSYDTRFGQAPRNSFSTFSSARESVASARNSIYETQPLRKSTYVDQGKPGSTISRTEYAIRPRRDSQTGENRKPLSVVTKNTSPSRDYPTVSESPREIVTVKAAARDNSSSRFLQPARASNSAHHQRHNSATRAELNRYHMPGSRDGRQKEYHRTGPYIEKVYPSTRPPVRYSEEDGYSYTGPREQFARDYPKSTARRESLSRRERPASAIDPEFKALPFRRENGPPPSASRQLERLDYLDAPRQNRSGFDSDPERSKERPQRRQSTRAPVLHQSRGDGYPPSADEYEARRPSRLRDSRYDDEPATTKDRYIDASRDVDRDRDRDKLYWRDYDREREKPVDRERTREKHTEREREKDRYMDREREWDRSNEHDRERDRDRVREHERVDRDAEVRRQPRSRDSSPEHSSGLKGIAAATGIGGLAAVAIANRRSRNEGEDEKEDEEPVSHRERRHRRRRSKDIRDDPIAEEDSDGHSHRSKHERRRRRHEGSGSDTPDDKQSHRRRSSRNKHENGSHEVLEESGHDFFSPTGTAEHDQNNSEVEHIRDRSESRDVQESPEMLEERTLSPGEGSDERPRKVLLVEPVKDKKEDLKPKGILKKPRQVPFPEDPNPEREGVAPLKAAGKDGIPPTARWTKISRMLVNPEALERTHERFEERDDYVIVLRVLTREEIERFAEKTREIREARERAWQEQLEDHRRRKAENENDIEQGPNDGDMENPAPLAIEAAPAPPVDLRNLQNQPVDLRNMQNQPVDLRNLQNQNTAERTPAAIPVPDINVETANYSQNV